MIAYVSYKCGKQNQIYVYCGGTFNKLTQVYRDQILIQDFLGEIR